MTKEEILAALKAGTGQALKTTLHGINLEGLPDSLKSFFGDMKTRLDTALGALPPTEQVPAALEAGQMLSYCVNRIGDYQSMLNDLMQRCAAMAQAFQTHAATEVDKLLPGKVADGLQQKLSAGEFISKADHEQALRTASDAAHKAGVTAGRELAQKHADRTTKLTGLKLKASEAVLLLEDAPYDAAVTEAQRRQGEAAKLTVHSKPFEFDFDFFAPAADWDRTYKIAGDACKAAETAGGRTTSHSNPRPVVPDPNKVPVPGGKDFSKITVG